MSENLKVLNFDKFKCIADGCTHTCCKGWEISVDNETYKLWESLDKNLLKNVSENEYGEMIINKKVNEGCKFLDSKGLCNVVKDHGEDCLSNACHTYPRIKNKVDNRHENLLSCSCPEVLNIIGKVTIHKENNELLELKIREKLIDNVYDESIDVEEALIKNFVMLLNILDNDEIDEDVILREINSDYEINFKGNIIKAIKETNDLLLDMTHNFRYDSGIEDIVEPICLVAEDKNRVNFKRNFVEFLEIFKSENEFMRNVLANKILNGITSDDMYEIVQNYEMIVIEYVLVRYSAFLKYTKTREFKISDLKEIVMAFSRIIENNLDASVEFFEEDFEYSIFDKDYLGLITIV